MKAIKQLAMIFVIFFMASVCTAAPAAMPEKYNLDNQLEVVSEITDNNFRDWEKVDNQSFIFQNSPSEFYLIILSGPSDELSFNDSVKIGEKNSIIKPGKSRVIISSSGIKERYVISKIYKLKDADQADEIREQLTRATK